MEKKNLNFEVKCPNCKKKFIYGNSDSRPFCTEKCKMIDLGHWFQEDYHLSKPISSEDEFREYEKALIEKGLSISEGDENDY